MLTHMASGWDGSIYSLPLNSSLAFQHFDDDKELINYANNLLLNEQIGVIVKTFSIGATSVSNFGYSIGFIFKRYSTIAIYVFSYNGNIYSNGKTDSSNWIGWQSH